MDADLVQSSITLWLLLTVILTLINAHSAASETAVIPVNKNRTHRKTGEEDRKATLVEKFLQEPTSFLSTIQVAITLADSFNSASAATGISVCPGATLETWAIPYGKMISTVVVTILLSFATLIFEELVPRRIALWNAETHSMFCAKLILTIPEIVSPFTKILSQSTRSVLYLFGMKNENVEEFFSREEIHSTVESGQESGVLDENEADMINNAFTFDNILAREVTTSRPDIFRISIDDLQSEYLDELTEMRYDRIPAYRNSIDNIIDILNIKDFIIETRKNGFKHVDISRILRKPFSVLEGRNIDDLFREMQSKHQHIAILIDEYGDSSGIVTMEDLAEEIMEDIEDEYDEDDEAWIEKPDEHTYVLSGGMSIDDISEELGLQLENDNHEVISGSLLGLIEQIPEGGEKHGVIWNHIEFQMKEVKYK